MITIVTIIHILVSIGLILVVLLQTGKGADMGAVFGGSSSTIFGSSGAGNFLTRLTTGMAIVFMITSLTLGYFSGKRASSSVFDSRTGQTEPAAPRGPATSGAAPQPAAPSATPQPQPNAPQK
jgi:preprotein translocase subunit SecG